MKTCSGPLMYGILLSHKNPFANGSFNYVIMLSFKNNNTVKT